MATEGPFDTKPRLEDREIMEILRHNGSFSRPEEWVQYARQHDFRKVPSQQVHRCPDCGSTERRKLGQFVHYSNLISLRECGACGLLYADTAVENRTIEDHFERTYKDERYFKETRKYVFEEVASLVERLAPLGGRVLDVGGAKGHMLAIVGERRPDLRRILNDLSPTACEWASSRYRLDVFCGRFAACEFRQNFDVVTMIDVIYYEPDLRALWERVSSLVKDGGHLILRLPNKYPLIRAYLKASALLRLRREKQASIRFLNPEHIYVMPRSYLRDRLASLGFEEIRLLPSAMPVERPQARLLYEAGRGIAKLVHRATLGHLLITPSVLVVARMKQRGVF